MTEKQADPPTKIISSILKGGWKTMRRIYFANSRSWKLFKSGALFFLGFFLWTGSNILYSVKPGWNFLYYSMAYGFILIFYGPIHHIVVIPLSLKLRKKKKTLAKIGKFLPRTALFLFITVVIVLGTIPPGVMTINFGSIEGGPSPIAINPDLVCVKSQNNNNTETIHCHLNRGKGIDRILVQSGSKTILVDNTKPFEFTLLSSDLQSITDTKQFQVTLQDEKGNLIRRYTRRLWTIQNT